ncbi:MULTISPECIES: hypothetical protein [unclassified Prochlorococcus]|nr:MULTISPECIES: hypothetical protein [unclassified Prochlorococcus]KGG25423.1 hypothetical protein EV12_2371 [Prochlorococcus sp. MIT 0701]KGG26448.1 hypothetical protein EV13_2582 [Prochlorococcus sp. MIT 0702]KGG31130.1 hypothetical protein EV14_2501 [Prochlorococcus sp. MIT 0703]
MLRKREQDAFKLALCLLVHGHVGGVVFVFILSLALLAAAMSLYTFQVEA